MIPSDAAEESDLLSTVLQKAVSFHTSMKQFDVLQEAASNKFGSS